MYEAVHAVPDGESTVARHAMTARAHGYDGVVVRNHHNADATYDADAIREAYDVEVVRGVEIRASNPQEASGLLGPLRRERDLVVLHGGTDALNRFGVEQDRVDVLAHPTRGEGSFNHVLAREAARNGVRVEFDLGSVLRRSGGPRVHAIDDLRLLGRLVEKYDVPYVVSAAPSSHLELRAPRELIAVGESIGIGAETVEAGLAEWGRLAARNRDRKSDSFIEPGVERGPYETDDR